MDLNKVKPGDPFRIKASTFNTMVDAARGFQEQQQTLSRLKQFTHRQDHATILIRNDSGADRQRFDVLELVAPVFTPTDNLDQFKSQVVMSGVAPDEDRQGRFAILLEPLADGKLGRACLMGSCVARVEMDDESHGFADTADGRMDALVSGSSGAAQLLWVQPEAQRDTPSLAWAIVRLGPPIQPAARLGVVVECQYDDVGGSLLATCVPLRGINYSYDRNDTRRIIAWGGINPMIVADMIVLLVEIEPLENNPEITTMAIPILSVPRHMLDMPDMNWLTAYTEPAGPAQLSTDLCVGD